MMLLVRECVDTGQQPSWIHAMRDVSRHTWSVTRDDAFLAARIIRNAPDTWQVGWALSVVEVMLSRTVADAAMTDAEASVLRELIGSVENRTTITTGARTTLRTRLVRLLPADSTELSSPPIAPVDGWAARVLPALRSHHDRVQVTALLRHLNQANGSKPTARWLAANTDLLANEQAVTILRLLLDHLLSAEPITKPSQWGIKAPVVVDALNTDMARAAVWAVIPIAEPWVVPTVHQLAARGIRSAALIGWLSGDKIPNACILALGRIGTPVAIAGLQQLADSTKNN
jgi:hypothetical protein